MTTRSIVRGSGRVVIPVALAGAVVGLAAAPALAAASISVQSGSSSVAGGTVRSYETVQASGSDTAPDRTGLSRSRTLSLTVVRPGGAGTQRLAPDKSVRSNAAGAITGSLDFSCPGWSAAPCVGAVNGDYVFTFSDGATTRTATVSLEVPPVAPTGFRAAANGTVATFAWRPNTEPDLMGYDIVTSDGTDVTPGGVDPSVCDSTGCSVSVNLGPSAAGTTRTFRISAQRHTAPGSGSSVDSAPSAPASATFPTAPTSGSPSPGGSGGRGGGGGGTSHGGPPGGGSGSGAGHRLTGKHPAADLRATLPTLRAGAAPNLPAVLTEVKPLPEGTYKPTLAYPNRTAAGSTTTGHRGATAAVVHDIGRVLDVGALWRGLAGAAVMMLVAAHLRAWVERFGQG